MPNTQFGYVTPENLPLFTDLYELKMMQGYLHRGHNPRATFDLFVRDLPADWGYAVAAGLEQALHYVEGLSFGDRALEYLAAQDFADDFLDHLSELSFTGDVRAIPEGTPVFPDEPLVEVTAPIVQAQLLETVLINQVGFQTLIATQAARMRDAVERAGGDQSLVDFGSRRAHGTDAGLKAARAASIGGFDGTSNVAAGEAFDIPVFGTMAHSWVQSFETERAAFEAFVDEYGDDSILLVDSYDTLGGARTAAEVAADRDVDLAGVRIDSGDLVALSRQVDGVVDCDVFVSSGVDEFFIRDFLDDGGVAAGFGPGTALATGGDVSTLDPVYKLVAVEREGKMGPIMKLSAGKATLPRAKSVRRVERDGQFDHDVFGTRSDGQPFDTEAGEGAPEPPVESPPGEEQLVAVVEDGRRVVDLPDLERIAERARRNVERLPPAVRRLEAPASYEVRVDPELSAETDALRDRLERQYGES